MKKSTGQWVMAHCSVLSSTTAGRLIGCARSQVVELSCCASQLFVDTFLTLPLPSHSVFFPGYSCTKEMEGKLSLMQ